MIALRLRGFGGDERNHLIVAGRPLARLVASTDAGQAIAARLIG